jgi:hypothetical protein
MHQKYTYVSIAQFHKVKLKTTYHLTTKVKQTESSVHNLICTISISTLNKRYLIILISVSFPK